MVKLVKLKKKDGECMIPTQFEDVQEKCIALVFQGGGALGAYQAGVYEELSKTAYLPHWVTGVSIGAINAAIIAGNVPEKRVDKLREFWNLVSSSMYQWWDAPTGRNRSSFNQLSAAIAMSFGVPGFYRPHLFPFLFYPEGSEEALGVYNTQALRTTLENVIDFDLINSKAVRLSVGAVNVRTGNSTYFDNTKHHIGPEHIMASGALPPAFPPVEIEGEAYWDGGIVSNTPLQYALDHRSNTCNLLVFQVDLFSAKADLPKNLMGVMQRHKEIMYSSRTRYSTEKVAEIENTYRALKKVILKLPKELREDPAVKHLEAVCCLSHVDIVHLIYRHTPYESDSMDYEFSRDSVLEHWCAGQKDTKCTLDHPEWLTQSGLDAGVTVYDLTRTI